jgi:hypothetical protein
LQEGIIAAKAGQLEQARFRLLDVVEQDQTNEAAWFWLYQVFDRRDDKRLCLENLIIINPQNQWAHEELLNYVSPSVAQQAARQPETGSRQGQSKGLSSKKAPAPGRSRSTSRPIALKLVVAFWLGISVIFTVGGIIAAGEWLISSARTRTFPYYLTGFQVVELLVAIIFVVAGVMGVYVAILLFLRSMAGFYGSVILALALLLVGPFISLIVDPPNYPALVCTGGISGMIVLLTLASQPGFTDT